MEYKVDKFDGGLTDFIYKDESNFAEKYDNLIVEEDGSAVTRFGSDIYNKNFPRVPTNLRITDLIELKDNLVIKSTDKLYYLDEVSGFSEIQSEDNRSLLYGYGLENNISYAILNDKLIITSTMFKFRPLLVNKELALISDVYQGTTLGLPNLAYDPIITPFAGAVSISYIYAFVYYRTYTTGALIYEEYGQPLYVNVVSTASEADIGTPYSITNIPTLANAINTFYNTGTASNSIKVKIFRTVNNGSTFYYLGDTRGLIDNGTIIATDDIADDVLELNGILYTEGGVVENDPPPTSKYVTVAKESVWFANESSFNNRVRQSKRLQPNSCPSDYFIDLDDEIIGMSSTRDFPIVFTKNKTYRIEGQIDDLGRGDLQKRTISDTIGCINNRAIVRTSVGIYFAGLDGVYFTDGYQVEEVTPHIRDTYLKLIDTEIKKNKLQGCYYPKEKKVFFSVKIATDNDTLYVFDEDFKAWSTMTGQTSFIPTAIGTFNGCFIRADDMGYIYVHRNDLYTDLTRNTGVAVNLWETEAIIYTFKHIAEGMKDYRLKKWVNRVSVQIDNRTGQHVQLGSYDERSSTLIELQPILVMGSLPWGASGTPWDTSGIFWGGNNLVSKIRRFPSNKLRTRFKQLNITNAWTTLFTSDTYGMATPNTSTKNIVLDDITKKWPTGIVNSYIKFDSDETEFKIIARVSDTTITVEDINNLLPIEALYWEIVGYKKSERLNLQNISYVYTPIGDIGKSSKVNE